MHTCHEFSLRHKTAENSPFRVVLNKTKLSKIEVPVRGGKKLSMFSGPGYVKFVS